MVFIHLREFHSTPNEVLGLGSVGPFFFIMKEPSQALSANLFSPQLWNDRSNRQTRSCHSFLSRADTEVQAILTSHHFPFALCLLAKKKKRRSPNIFCYFFLDSVLSMYFLSRTWNAISMTIYVPYNLFKTFSNFISETSSEHV